MTIADDRDNAMAELVLQITRACSALSSHCVVTVQCNIVRTLLYTLIRLKRTGSSLSMLFVSKKNLLFVYIETQCYVNLNLIVI